MKIKTIAGMVLVVGLASVISYQAGLRNGKRSIPDAVLVPSDDGMITIDAPPRRRSFSRASANPSINVRYDLNFKRVAVPAVLNWGSSTRRQASEAEVFDANAMRDYQMRWEQRLRYPSDGRQPSFNPSAVERLFER